MSGQDALIFLLQTLKEVAKDYSDLKKGARYQFEQLQNELGRLDAHLKEAAMVSDKSYTFKENERQIRKLVYEVEDTIDTYLTKKAASKTKNFFGKIPGIISTTMEGTVRDLREKKVAPALQLVQPPGPAKAKAGDGSTKSLGKPPMEGKKDDTISKAETSDDVELTIKGLQHDERVCCLYTGLFPKDYEIPASTLTQLWIAERFIHPEDDGTSLEETAEKILNHLIHKKLLTAGQMRLDQVKTCRVDDRVRMFCQKKGKEETLFTVIESSVLMEQSFYRLCFHSDPSTFLSEIRNLPYVRSFLCLTKDSLYLNPTHISTIPNAFKPLRILSCKSIKFEELPKNITSLILLKHVTLSIDKLEFLPEDISKLSNLQTLIVETQSPFITVKANIWKMMQLRHLKTKASFILDDKKWKLGAVHKNLQTVSRLSTESCSAALSEKAPNLKSLGIRGNLNDADLDSLSLQKFCHLEKLKLVNYVRYGSPDAHPLLSLPPADHFPLKLKRLTLSNTYLIWNRHMATLARIDTLEILKLKDNAFKGASWSPRGDDVFTDLHFLLIKNADLGTWKASTKHFPALKCLVIKKCKNLKVIPEGLAQVEKVEIDDVLRKPQLK